jgi:hypothetical protein
VASLQQKDLLAAAAALVAQLLARLEPQVAAYQLCEPLAVVSP